MKPSYQKVPCEATSCWTLLHRQLPDAIPFEWHHHPEFELTLTLNSRGQRYVGSDVAAYDDGDLVLVGADVAHSWLSTARIDPALPHTVLVIWFSREWAQALITLCPELADLGALLATTGQALQFSAAMSAQLRPVIEAMVEQDEGQRLLSLLTVLHALCQDIDAQPIAPTTCAQAWPGVTGNLRMRRVLEHIHHHYTRNMTLAELAQLACVSVSALHRMFRRHTQCTVLAYIARLRISQACALLMQDNLAIAAIAEQVGYRSQVLFNRQFKALKGVTPSMFRQQHGRHFR